MAQDNGVVVLFLINGTVASSLLCPVGGQKRKKGGGSCAKCGVKRPVPLSEWLERLSWTDGMQFLFEQAEVLAPAVELCVNQGWAEYISSDIGQDWLFDQLDLAILTWVNAGDLAVLAGKDLRKRFKQVVRRKGFFAPAYRGIPQEEILDCARRLSVELWRNGARPDIVLRPGGEYYTYLHSLCNFLFETKKKVTLADLCEAVDTKYPNFSPQEKRLVFAFCLMREYARRLNRHDNKLSGISRSRQELILDFIRRTAISS